MRKKNFKVLDKGFIRIVDTMGDDSSIVQAARVSYGRGTKHTSQDRALIRYLLRHKHTSPFEMCEIKLHLKMPMCIGEQWLRHRTASVNKYSGRYSVMEDEFYIPEIENMQKQSQTNKQGREEGLSLTDAKDSIKIFKQHCAQSYAQYEELLKKGVAREIARMVLPANIYTQFYWKCNLHNLMHFMRLRSHPSAQYEIRAYSLILEQIVKEWVPITHEAFQDYVKDSVSVSKHTLQYLQRNSLELADLGKTEQLEFDAIWKK
jgi:thymidylate synthase (FAD)